MTLDGAPPRHHRRTPRQHRGIRVTLVAAVFLVAVAGTGAALAYRSLQSGVERHDLPAILGTDRPTAGDVGPDDSLDGRPVNILVMGSDSRDGDDNAELGGGDRTGMRSDTTLLLHISADRTRVDAVSIPRDLLVDIPGCPRPDGSTSPPRYAGDPDGEFTMFNEAFAIGAGTGDLGYAAACTVLTFQTMTDIPVDDFVVVEMSGFRDMVDAIGGVHICVEQDMSSRQAGLDITAGCHTLDGENALALARARKGPGLGDGSDVGRIDRQQELLTAMVQQVLDRNVLTDSGELFQFLRAATSSLTTGDRIGNLTTMAGLTYSLRDVGVDQVNFATMPYDWAGARVLANDDSEALWSSIRADQPMQLPATEEGT
ncbi:LCP family protein [Ruania alba]|uniref:Cell envelope-related function transcriptional attenuator common domain-containing protein n=1 Tax=Ruania alba TaxID=648782 RepID=A0A1H5NAU5_9MICO|nr:LCP family protein [Ruania alba]SEE98017.1 cell envelope-related function transcriptional attenuator common domain-containing protein [Ruania alba]